MAPSKSLQWLDVCAIDDVLPGTGLAAVVNTEQVAIVRTRDGLLAALSNFDPFSKAFVIAQGTVGNRAGVPEIASPIYKQRFSLKTGECLDDASVRLAVFPVRVSDGRIQIALPAGRRSSETLRRGSGSMHKANLSPANSDSPCRVGFNGAAPTLPSAQGTSTKAALRRTCSDVVGEYLAGRWPELDSRTWQELCAFLLEELLARCPGLSTREYRVALMTRLSMRGILSKPRPRAALRAATRMPDPVE
jgi:nitrite reductase (NADH) small subunit